MFNSTTGDNLPGERRPAEYVADCNGWAHHVGHLSECGSHQLNDFDDDYSNRPCSCGDDTPEWTI